MKKKGIVGVSIVLAMFVLMSATPMSLGLTSAQKELPPKGPWVDEIVYFTVESDSLAVEMMKRGEMHTYFYGLSDPELVSDVKLSPELWHTVSYGSYNELTFNPVGPEFPATGKLNPFSVPRIREAMNWLVDRKYIADEICGGLGIPRYLAITPSFPDYARLIDTAKKIETGYRYDFEKAKSVIEEEMPKLGATLEDGKWKYEGEPVEIILLIRIEDERKDIGDYVASQLEKLGFTCVRLYKTSSEAAPIWLFGDPAEGKFHIYTGGWITTRISRDQSSNFDFFYTPRGITVPLWQAYTPSEEFNKTSFDLSTKNYTTWEKRNELMAKALTLSMKDSVRVWLVNSITPWAARKELEITCDLAGGFYGARVYPWTIKLKDQPGGIGGTVRIGTHDLLIEPWNPIGGSNWIYDLMVNRATFDSPLMADPFTGLSWPHYIKNATVHVKSGLPVTKSLDWVDFKFTDEIEVPTDAWYGWNATARTIETAPEGTKAKAKVIAYFNDDLFTRKYHDGSKISLADFVFSYIYTFDRVDPASPVYDDSALSEFKTFREDFKGLKIISEDPLVVEYYTNLTYPDAEWIATSTIRWFGPWYDFGPGPWHTVTLGWIAEKEDRLAFTSSKAEKLGVDRVSYIAGPSIPILKEVLDTALTEKFIPYSEVLGDYVSAETAEAKYKALKTWYEAKGHFHVGYGPFYLESVDPTAEVVVIKAFRDHADSADKWARFKEPKIPEVSVTTPLVVEKVEAEKAEILVEVTYKGELYPIADTDFVKYLLIDAEGNITLVGEAESVEDGKWKIVLSRDVIENLTEGSTKIIVVVVSKLVSIPASEEASFVVFESLRIIELTELVGELEGSLKDLEENLSYFKEYLPEAFKEVFTNYTSEVNVTITTLKEALEKYEEIVSGLETETTELRSELETERTETSDLKASISDLSARADTLSAIAVIAIIVAIVAIIATVIAVRRKK